MKSSYRYAITRLLPGILLFAALGLQASAGQGKSGSASGAPIDLNSATEKELESLPGVGPATAKKIIAGRPYSSPGDLSKAGVPSGTIAKVSPLVTAGGASPSSKPSMPIPPPAPVGNPPASQSASLPAPAVKNAPAATSQSTPTAGSVWVNMGTGVYHYSSSRYYGKTKNGKYMSEQDAVKAGYHAAKNEKKQ